LLSRKFTRFASLHPICSIMVAANQHVFGVGRQHSRCPSTDGPR
jgi:hypothetical protein